MRQVLRRSRARAAVLAMAMLAVTSCGTATPSSPAGVTPSPSTAGATPSPTPAGATSYLEFHTGVCAAFDSLFKAVGNPDTASGSELSLAMDAAIAAGDMATVDSLAAQMAAELAAGRRQLEFASGWPTGRPMVVQVDRVLAGFEALVEARRGAARQGPTVARDAGQNALMQSGAVDAWFAIIRPGVLDDTWHAIQSARPAGVSGQCPNVPISF